MKSSNFSIFLAISSPFGVRFVETVTHPSSLITHHSSLITHHSSLITLHSSLITHHSSLITLHSSLRHSSLITSLPSASALPYPERNDRRSTRIGQRGQLDVVRERRHE